MVSACNLLKKDTSFIISTTTECFVSSLFARFNKLRKLQILLKSHYITCQEVFFFNLPVVLFMFASCYYLFP